MKTRGIADFEHMVILKPALEQILTGSQHTWSEKTMRHFPPLLRDALSVRLDKRPLIIQAWQQVLYHSFNGRFDFYASCVNIDKFLLHIQQRVGKISVVTLICKSNLE